MGIIHPLAGTALTLVLSVAERRFMLSRVLPLLIRGTESEHAMAGCMYRVSASRAGSSVTGVVRKRFFISSIFRQPVPGVPR